MAADQVKEELLSIIEQNKKNWSDFMERNIINENVRPIIAQSWVRSKFAGIDPSSIDPPVLSEQEFIELREKNKILLHYATPLVNKLAELSPGKISTLSLHDCNGYMLESFESNKIWLDSKFIPGVRWAESDVGTNALGLVLIEQKPVQLLGAEHYYFEHNIIACCAAPIFDAADKFIGVLNVSVSIENYSEHLLSMVVLCCHAISNQIKNAVNNLIDSQIVKTADECMLAVDMHNTIIRCSRRAARLLNTNISSVIGLHIQDVIHISELDAAFRCPASENVIFRECRSYYNNNYMTCDVTASQITDSDITLGLILNIKNTKETARFIADYMGKYSRYSFNDVKTCDKEMLRLISSLKEISQGDKTITLIGEPGVDKEIIANAIHTESKRKDNPFVSVNCYSEPYDQLAIRLFGCEYDILEGPLSYGSIGQLEIAGGGTIYISGIENTSMETQLRILQILKTNSFYRYGGNINHFVDVRFIFSTNTELDRLMNEHHILPELYQLISGNVYRISPLRDRLCDINVISQHTLQTLNKINHTASAICDGALDILHNYSWPGNIRQLQNVIVQAYYFVEKKDITKEAIDAQLSYIENSSSNHQSGCTCHNLEKESLSNLLKLNNLDVQATAQSLNISRATLYRKMKELGIKCRDLQKDQV